MVEIALSIHVKLFVTTLRKHAFSNMLKISPPKTESFQIKNSDIFSYFCSKHRLKELVKAALPRRF